MTRRSLPGPMVDLVRDGVAPQDLRRRGNGAVWRALVRVAASSQQRQQDFIDFAGFVSDPRSALGRQARAQGGADLSRREFEGLLQRAWLKAEKWVASAPPPITRESVIKRIGQLQAALIPVASSLPAAERLILCHAIERALSIGTDRPALPRRAIAASTGLGESKVRAALRRLDASGLLVLVEPGRPGGPNCRRRRANLFRLGTLSDLDRYLAECCVARNWQTHEESGREPKHVTLPPPGAMPVDQESVTLTISAVLLPTVLSALAAERMRAPGGPPVPAAEADWDLEDLPSNVIPLRRRRTAGS